MKKQKGVLFVKHHVILGAENKRCDNWWKAKGLYCARPIATL